MDRLTREEISQALNLVCDILRSGIIIHTTMNEKFYTSDSLNYLPDMMLLLVELHMANEHSRKLQKRLKEFWSIRRKDVADGKVKAYSKTTPYWIDSRTWVPIEKQAGKIRTIFAKYNGGWGMTKITKYLNQNKILPLRKGMNRKTAQWTNSMVSRVLKDEHVIGRYRLNKVEERSTKTGRKRSAQIPVGEVIEGYFPPIISEADFAKANSILNSRKKKKMRDNQSTRNIAAGLLYCSCGSRIQRITSGSGHSYLICNSKKNGLGCNQKSVRYEPWEKVILGMLLTRPENFTRQRSRISDKLDLLETELERNQQEQENLTELARSLESPNKILSRKLDQLTALERKILEQIKAEKIAEKSAVDLPQDVADLTIEKIQSSEDLRRMLKVQLHKVIRRIIFDNGEFEIEFEDNCNEADLFRVAEPLIEVWSEDKDAA